MKKLYQQGDVLIKECDIPEGAEKQGHVTLALGEATGHHHRIDNARKAVLYMVGAAMYLKVLEMVRVIHEEHNPVWLPPGEYAVGFVREYDHFEEEARRVVD